MSNSLAKLELENTTRLLFFKHRGDLPAVIKELRAQYGNEIENTGERITVAYVSKVIKKLKKQQKANDPFVATNIMDYVFMGTKQRELLWDTDAQELEAYKFYYLSACCNARVTLHTNDEEEHYFICLKCEKVCSGYRVPDLKIFELQRKLRAEKRSDEEHLVKAADSLGFGEEKAPILKNYQSFNQVVVPESSRRVTSKEIKKLPANEQQLIVEMEEMDPRDRETIRKDLEMIRRKVDGDGWPEE